MELWAGAGRCDTSKGTLAGKVEVIYNGGLIVNVLPDPGVTVKEEHVYAGSDELPQVKRGKRTESTVAPGQYYIEKNLKGDIYVIVHTVVGMPDPGFGPK